MKSVDEKTQEIIEHVENEMRFESIPVKDVLHAFEPVLRIAAAASNFVLCKHDLTESQSRSSKELKEYEHALIQEVLKYAKETE